MPGGRLPATTAVKSRLRTQVGMNFPNKIKEECTLFSLCLQTVYNFCVSP